MSSSSSSSDPHAGYKAKHHGYGPASDKPGAIKLADSNLAMFGTPLERQVKKDSAKTERAWDGAGQQVGLQIWRIEKFKVAHWPKEQYGQFYRGDSYIVMNTYKKDNKILYDLHFWLGSETTQDEAGTAAYKTVELDTLLDDVPVQHREVEGHESQLFLSYFRHGVRLLEGGIDSGFNRVKPVEYKPRLMHVKGTFKTISVSQVPISYQSLNSGDVFILDCGLKIYQWNGSGSSGMERMKAGQLCRAIDDERGGLPQVIVLSEGDSDDSAAEFWAALGGQGPVSSASAPDSAVVPSKTLLQLSDATGQMVFREVARGAAVNRRLLNSSDVFIFDNGAEVFAWVGRGASPDEKSSAMMYAAKYLQDYNRPLWTPITRVLEGGENEVFNESFNK